MGFDRESVGVRMSLVYNNDKPIGKCESYSIDKIHGTTPFVMLTNYEPLRSELSSNQQVVLEWLKKKYKTTDIEPIELIWRLRVNSNSDKWRLQPPYKNYRYLTEIAQFQVLVAFAEWGMKQC